MPALSETFFGLSHRPFRGTPDPQDYVPVGSMEQEVRRLAETAAHGDGIGVLTAPPGAGKSMACAQLHRELSDQFVTAILSSSGFATRRSLLQAVHFALGQDYEGLCEQELRLNVLNLARSRGATRSGGIVLIVDEAHLLNPRLLEELRCLTNHSEGGRPLIRIILCGQLALEDTLVSPELEAFNYRITCHATLEPLSMQESAELIAGRAIHAGQTVDSLFTPAVLETICRVSDGNPRCLVQLCDHALALAAAKSESPVSVDTIRIALSELKQLPLQWNDSAADQPVTADEFRGDQRDGLTECDSVAVATDCSTAAEAVPNLDRNRNDDDVLPAWSASVSSVEVGSCAVEPADDHASAMSGWSSFESTPMTSTDDQASDSFNQDISDEAISIAADSDPVEEVSSPVHDEGVSSAGKIAEDQPSQVVEVAVCDTYALLDRSTRRSNRLPSMADLVDALNTLASAATPRRIASRTDTHAAQGERVPPAEDVDLQRQVDEIMSAVSFVANADFSDEGARSPIEPADDHTGAEFTAAAVPWQAAGDSRHFDLVEPGEGLEHVEDAPPWNQADSSAETVPVGPHEIAPEAVLIPESSRTGRPYVRLFSQLRKQRA